jgi:outer membrane protein OmpA-like peptidoglycan-associated protein
VDYAIVPFGILGETHRFSLTYRFGPEGPPPEKVTKQMLALQIHPEGADLKAGTLQQATFNLANKIEAHTDIKNWVFEIKDKSGAVIRTYSGKGIPPAQLSWDGKDANGNVVPGGLFANANLRTVDSHGLEVSSSEPIFKLSEAATQKGPAFTAPILPRNLVPTGYWGTLQLPDVFFSPGSPAIHSDYFNYLDQVIQLIRQYPNARVYVEGHAYEEGDERVALRLSQDRADSVLRYLVEKGKISPHNLYARGHGSSAPLESGGSEEFKFKNRRVTIVIFTK